MQTKALIKAMAPWGLADVIVDYAIAPDGADSRTIGVFACFEQCELAPDVISCIDGAVSVNAELVAFHLIARVAPSVCARDGAVVGGRTNLIKKFVSCDRYATTLSLAEATLHSSQMMDPIISAGITESMAVEAFNIACKLNAPDYCLEELMKLGAATQNNFIVVCEQNRYDLIMAFNRRNVRWPVEYDPLNIKEVSDLTITLMVISRHWSATSGFELACRSGNTRLAQSMIETDSGITPIAAELAAKANCQDLVEFILVNHQHLAGDALRGAAVSDHPRLMLHIETLFGRWLKDCDYAAALVSAAQSDSDMAVKWLILRGISPDLALRYSCGTGASKSVQHLLSQQHESDVNELFGIACHMSRFRPAKNDKWPSDYLGVYAILYKQGAAKCTECGRSVEAHMLAQ